MRHLIDCLLYSTVEHYFHQLSPTHWSFCLADIIPHPLCDQSPHRYIALKKPCTQKTPLTSVSFRSFDFLIPLSPPPSLCFYLCFKFFQKRTFRQSGTPDCWVFLPQKANKNRFSPLSPLLLENRFCTGHSIHLDFLFYVRLSFSFVYLKCSSFINLAVILFHFLPPPLSIVIIVDSIIHRRILYKGPLLQLSTLK